MGISKNQLRDIIIRPALYAVGLYSDNAIELLMLTAAVESGLGTFIRQNDVGDGTGAYGIFQMERMPYDEIWNNVINTNSILKTKMKLYLQYPAKPTFQRMVSDLALATIMARLYYMRIKEPLPSFSDVKGMAEYWKKYWNTAKGSGSVDKAIVDYNRYLS